MDNGLPRSRSISRTGRRIFRSVVADPWRLATFLAWNIGVLASQLGFGILAFELSRPQLQRLSQRMMIFPLSFPHAIALAASCCKGNYVTLGIFVGFYGNRLYYLVYGVQTLTAFRCLVLLVVALIRTAGICVIRVLLRRFICGETKKVPRIDGMWDAVWYFLVVSIATVLAEVLVALVECFGHMLAWRDFGLHWGTWWLGEVAAMVTVSPCFIHGFSWEFQSTFGTPAKMVELVFICGTTLLMLVLVFLFNVRTYVRPLPYLVYPFLVHSAFRFNRKGWAVIILVISTFCSWATIEGKGALFNMSGGSLEPRLVVQVELYASVAAGVAIALTASVRETRAMAKKLKKLNEGLETLVQRRMEQLTRANKELTASKIKVDLANSAKSAFLRNVCHEIRTPLHGILGMSTLMSETDLTEFQTSSITTITECADVLLQIMNSILDLAKIDTSYSELEQAQFDVHYVLTSTMHILEPTAKQNYVQLKWKVDEAVPKYLIGDSGKLRQCLLNLVANALKFSRKGCVNVDVLLQNSKKFQEDEVLSTIDMSKLPEGLVEVTETKSFVVPEHVLEATVHRPRKPPKTSEVNLLLKISDTGIGISREQLQSIFHRFVQADASISRLYGGTGLGLSIVQRSVELMSGQLLVSSETGKGTTFYILLPFYLEQDVEPRPSLTSAEDAIKTESFKGSGFQSSEVAIEETVIEKSMDAAISRSTITPSPLVSPQGTREDKPLLEDKEASDRHQFSEPCLSPKSSFSILLVEDNIVNQKVASQLLQRSGHSVTVVGDGVQAVAALRSNRPSFDLVLMDIQMPNMDGLEATRCIRDEERRSGCKRIPIIGLTAHAMQGYHETCSSAGMDGYMAKPFEIKKLLGCIERIVTRHIPA